ncbi:hypothetical protein BN874_690050 [Candidatus Contendobacter odensis Run_B_J11]|uniref:Uncharacterized protein n=1 Tax=Candidatus Contendobacter odensis Run_B_J11 TaxID=1400861 RepID=A0A7U7J597_9GAMM|nr:hypothetical protein BN874_690050 [Candidatus Contendobacter odensis Run_B_J11]
MNMLSASRLSTPRCTLSRIFFRISSCRGCMLGSPRNSRISWAVASTLTLTFIEMFPHASERRDRRVIAKMAGTSAGLATSIAINIFRQRKANGKLRPRQSFNPYSGDTGCA